MATPPPLQRLAPPGVTLLVCFLAFSSQWLFQYIEPGPLRKGDVYIFNSLIAALLISHLRACYTDPGQIPSDWKEKVTLNGSREDAVQLPLQQRWCRKCSMYKPPRAHHCKTCKRSDTLKPTSLACYAHNVAAASWRWTTTVSGQVGCPIHSSSSQDGR